MEPIFETLLRFVLEFVLEFAGEAVGAAIEYVYSSGLSNSSTSYLPTSDFLFGEVTTLDIQSYKGRIS